MSSSATIHEPVAAPAGAGARRKLGAFVRVLRDNGFIIGLAEISDALTVLSGPDSSTPSPACVRRCGRCCAATSATGKSSRTSSMPFG